MIAVPGGVKVLVATKPVDFRKGADGLAAMVREQLRHDPFSGTIFIFRSKRADRLKILAWDGSGLVLLWKRLEHGLFRWPPISAPDHQNPGARGRLGQSGRVDAHTRPNS